MDRELELQPVEVSPQKLQDDISAIIHHAIEGAEVCGKFCEDALRAGDDDLAEFFRDMRQRYQVIVVKAKHLLDQQRGIKRDVVEKASADSFPASDPPAHH